MSGGVGVMRTVVRGIAAAGVAAFGWFAAGAPAQAIVINDAAFAAGDALTLGAPFDSVVRITYTSGGSSFMCSGALISATSVLTADHCARKMTPGAVTVSFTTGNNFAADFTRGVSQVFTFGADSSLDLLNGSDLAVLTLQSGVTNRLPFMLYDGGVIGDMGRFVGFGRSGNGTNGATVNDGRRRAAENVIDWYGAAKGCGGPQGFCTASGSTNILSTDFDNGTSGANSLGGSVVGSEATLTRYEGSTAPGDSGGPILVLRDEVWLIAGVTSGGNSQLSQYGDVAWFTSVASAEARAFVLQTARDAEYWVAGTTDAPDPDFDGPAPIPVPPAGLLLAGALALAVLRRRGRARPAS